MKNMNVEIDGVTYHNSAQLQQEVLEEVVAHESFSSMMEFAQKTVQRALKTGEHINVLNVLTYANHCIHLYADSVMSYPGERFSSVKNDEGININCKMLPAQGIDDNGNGYCLVRYEFKVNWSAIGSVTPDEAIEFATCLMQVADLATMLTASCGWALDVVSTPESRHDAEVRNNSKMLQLIAAKAVVNASPRMRVSSQRMIELDVAENFDEVCVQCGHSETVTVGNKEFSVKFVSSNGSKLSINVERRA